MTWSEKIGSLLKKQTQQEMYVSLYVDVHTVGASLWHLQSKGKVHTLASAHLPIKSDSWQARIEAVDRLLGALEEKTGTDQATKTILGLPPAYLTQTGEIKKEIRSELKNLSEELELSLVGFVSLHQALLFKLKSDEGVPPSVVLLGVAHHVIEMSVYKIGSLVETRTVEEGAHISESLEHAFKSFTKLEVLPARLLLYGDDENELKQVKAKLLAHPWTSKANFLHFPKIEIVTYAYIVDALSLAGSSEITEELQEIASEPDTKNEQMDEEVEAAQQTINEEFIDEEVQSDDNVRLVDPEALGFSKKEDILETNDGKREFSAQEDENDEEEPQKNRKFPLRFSFPAITFLHPKRNMVILGIVVTLLLILFGIAWFLPHATVTILQNAHAVESTQDVTIDPESTEVDINAGSIPGRMRQQDATGEKTIEVKGTKNIGDPAKGTVTIYNKSIQAQKFTKGTTISSGTLKFTLDGDVEIASASESIGSLTFGKNDVSVTAVQIGTQSNLASGKEFAIANTSSNIAIGRNDAAFTGGTSRQVVVVTRSDYDAFVAQISKELVQQAKNDLASQVLGQDVLIDETITTEVKEKVFQQELDEESSTLSGKVTVTVSGVAYNQEDVYRLFAQKMQNELPAGYALDKNQITATVSDVKIAKDKTISAALSVHGISLPTIDTQGLPGKIAGKSITEATELLQSVSGVAGISVRFSRNIFGNRLPLNTRNISIDTTVQE